MEIINSFKDFYDKHVEVFKELEIKRRKSEISMLKGVLIAGTVILTCGSLIFFTRIALGHVENGMSYLVVGFIIFCIVSGIIYNECFKDFKREYYDRVIGSMVKWFGPELEYKPRKYISQNEFEKSRLFIKSIDRYSGSHLREGKIGKTMVRFSLVHAGERIEEEDEDSDGHKHTHTRYETIFKGIFFIADFNKEFKTKIVCVPERRFQMERITLEDPEFHRYFYVYGEDQIDSRYVLSTSLMRRIVQLKMMWKKEVRLSFIPPYVYVALPYEGHLFEPPCHDDLLKDRNLETYFKQLAFITGIVEVLDLNTRIWGNKACV